MLLCVTKDIHEILKYFMMNYENFSPSDYIAPGILTLVFSIHFSQDFPKVSGSISLIVGGKNEM